MELRRAGWRLRTERPKNMQIKNDGTELKEHPASSSNDLLARVKAIKFRPDHEESWKNKVAQDLEEIRARVEWTLETMGEPCDVDIEFSEAALRIISRVEHFEVIERANAGADAPATDDKRTL